MPTREAFGRADLGGQRPGPELWPCSPQKLVRCSRDVGSREEVASARRRSSQEVGQPPGYAHLQYRQVKHNHQGGRYGTPGTYAFIRIARLVQKANQSSPTCAGGVSWMAKSSTPRVYNTAAMDANRVRGRGSGARNSTLSPTGPQPRGRTMAPPSICVLSAATMHRSGTSLNHRLWSLAAWAHRSCANRSTFLTENPMALSIREREEMLWGQDA